ncbi:MAG: hypothetical protein AABZ69_04385, partial [Candidatus Binatota bacterium]
GFNYAQLLSEPLEAAINAGGLSPKTAPLIKHESVATFSTYHNLSRLSSRQTLPGLAAYLPNDPQPISFGPALS